MKSRHHSTSTVIFLAVAFLLSLAAMSVDAADDAAVVSANLPNALACGATYQASVTMRNTGTSTWSSDVFKLGPVGDSDDLNGPARIYLPNGVTVPPGGEHTFEFTLRAPASARIAVTDWRMVHEGLVWFGAIASRSVSISCTATTDNAQVVASDLPSTLELAQTYRASVTFANTGTTTWTPDIYKLGPVGDADDLNGPGRVYLPNGTTVPPGGRHTFEFTLTAPAVETTAVTDWRMVHEGVRWFGQTAAATVRVTSGDDAVVIASDLPGTMVRGEAFEASVTMRNSGSSRWTPEGLFRLGAVGDEDPFTDVTRIDLPPGASVDPGQTHTFRFTLTAPLAFGRKLTDWQMVHDNVAWFGGIAASDVYVERRENDAAVVDVMMPEATMCGEDFVATITMRNTGNLAWDAERGYGLRARDNDDAFSTAGTWFPIPPGITVDPEETHAFEIPMRAPDLSAAFLTDWRMEHLGNGFGPIAARTIGVWCGTPGPAFPVRPGLWPASPDESSPDDLDGDGIPQALELQLAQYFFPTIWMDIEERCPSPGGKTGSPGRLVFRARPHPADASKIAISYALLFARDCGDGLMPFSSHNGDVEPFAITVEPNPDCPNGYAARAIHTWAHEGTPAQASNGRQLDGRCRFGFSVDATGKDDIVVSSEDKHGNYLSLDSCDDGNLWTDHCSYGFTMGGVNSWVGFNAGEPNAPRHRDLGPLGFAGEKMWSGQRFCGGHEWASNCPAPVEQKMSDTFVATHLAAPTPTPAVTCEMMGGDLCTTAPTCPMGYVAIGPASNCTSCCKALPPSPTATPTPTTTPPPAPSPTPTPSPTATPGPQALTCYDYTNMYPKQSLCYDAGWAVCERRYRGNGIGGTLTCWKGFK